jgi:hypothetical protein
MNVTIVASLISAGTALASEFLRHRPSKVDYPNNDRLYQLLDEKGKEQVITVEGNNPQGEHIDIRVGQSISKPVVDIPVLNEPETISEHTKDNKATSIATGCIPCSLGHVGTCSGLLKEGVRFASGPDGVSSPEVIDRVNMCLDELNTMERVDMSPSMIQQLPAWEKDLAHDVLAASRSTRHELEDVSNFDRLEEIAAKTDDKRKEIGRKWFAAKLANLSDQDKANIQQRIIDKLNDMKTKPEE